MNVILVGGSDIGKRIPFAVRLINQGHNVLLLGADQLDSSLNGVSLSGFEMYLGLNPVRVLRSIYDLRSKVLRHNPNIVHSFDTVPSTLLGVAMMFRNNDISLIKTVTGMGRGWVGGSWLLRLFYCMVNRILRRSFNTIVFQNTEDMKDYLDFKMVKGEQAVKIPGSGVDDLEFNLSVVGETPGFSTGLSTDTVNVVCITRILRSKGVLEFLELARVAKDKLTNFEFYLIGEVDESDTDHVSISKIESYSGYVNYLGHREDIPLILAQSRISVLWSTYGEGVPRSLIESSFMGHVIYTLDSRGCRELVQDGVNGRISPENQQERYSQFINDCENSFPSLRSNAENMVPNFKVTYSLKSIVEQYASVYSNRSV